MIMYPECNHFGGGYHCGGCNPRLAYPFGRATVGQFIACPSPHHPAFQPPAPSPRHPAYQPAPSPKHPACQPSAPPEPPQQGTGYPSPHAGAGIGYPVNCMPPPSPMPMYYVPVASPTRIFSTTHVTVHLPQTAVQPALSSKSKRRRGPWFCKRCCDVEVA